MSDAKSIGAWEARRLNRSEDVGSAHGVRDLETSAQRLDGAAPEEILRWAWAEYGPLVKLVTSFGPEASVLVEAMARVVPAMSVLTVDTGRLPEETHAFIETLQARYGIRVEVRLPNHRAVEALVRDRGPCSFRRDVEQRRACCAVRKVDPLRHALTGLRAWVTGIRREQTPTRAKARVAEWDPSGGLVKINPLVHWTWEDVVRRLRERRLPTHPLMAKGYTSIGCAPCTRAIRSGEDPRAGRWWWESCGSRECGLHI